MLYMVIEKFKDSGEIYRRLEEKGRMMPDGLNYVSSWIDADLKQCFQLMETSEFELFGQWTSNWDDLTDFEIIPVMTSTQAREISLKQS